MSQPSKHAAIKSWSIGFSVYRNRMEEREHCVLCEGNDVVYMSFSTALFINIKLQNE